MPTKNIVDNQYNRNFLSNVIFRLDFTSIQNSLLTNVDNFRTSIKEPFPVYKTQNMIEYTAKIEQGKELDNSQIESVLYTFEDKNLEKKISLAHKFLTIEFFKYNNLTEFNANVKQVVDTFLSLYPTIDFSRFGLRYINQIVLEKGNPFIWKDYISSYLTSTVDNFFSRDTDLSRAMSQVVLNRDDFKLIFNFGLFNSEYPAKISRKEFVLDYDCFTEYFTNDEIYTNLEKFNNEIKIMFEKSIKDPLRNIMGVVK
jgi:uncharacterized protein (TIGR04255 family)